MSPVPPTHVREGQVPEPRSASAPVSERESAPTVVPARSPAPIAAAGQFAFLRDRAFLAALALALPAFIAFLLAPWFGLAVRVPSPAWSFVLLFPVLEELAFRGLLQGQLLRVQALARPRWQLLSGASVLTAVAFAAAHLLREPWPWAVATFFPGLVFGWARDRSGGVLAPMVLHVAYNLSVWLAAMLSAWLGSEIVHWLPEWITASTVLAAPASGGG